MDKMVTPGLGRSRWAIWLAHPSALVIALAVSLAVHITIYVLTPAITTTFTPTKPVQYDASLVPLESVPAKAKITETRAADSSRTNTRSAAPAEAQPRRTTPKSAANFAAPENAIAVPALAAGATPEQNAEPSTSLEGGAGASGSAGGAEKPLGNQAGDTAPGSEAAKLPAPLSAPLSADPVAQPAVAQAPARRAPAFAERISIEYKLSTAITDGVASFRWNRRGADYEIESSIQATGFLVSAFAGVIHQQSRGTITDDGLRPQQFSIRRGEGEVELAEFRRGTNALAMKRNGETRSVPLTRDMQDMQSFLFQLAYDAPHMAESGDKLDVLVTNARKVYRYQFRKLGTETLDTRMGPIETIRLLAEAANPEDQYEVWLAPAYFYLPVQLKYFLGRFQVEQMVTRIGVSSEVTAR